MFFKIFVSQLKDIWRPSSYIGRNTHLGFIKPTLNSTEKGTIFRVVVELVSSRTLSSHIGLLVGFFSCTMILLHPCLKFFFRINHRFTLFLEDLWPQTSPFLTYHLGVDRSHQHPMPISAQKSWLALRSHPPTEHVMVSWLIDGGHPTLPKHLVITGYFCHLVLG